MSKSCSKPTILICDDEEGVRESFKLILEDRYQLHLVNNGIEALDALKTLKPDLMLLDIKMPKMHGMEILKAVKKIQPSLPVIIVTGYQSDEMAQEAMRLGAAGYLSKPFSSNALISAIKQTI